jgi:AraC family transcriptional regulator of adaptative response/methylated-DNA-[protein]-cysteine methyltransferase
MTDYDRLSDDYLIVEKAIRYLNDNSRLQPDLPAVADHVGMSEYHFQRLFTRWAGISPKRFLQYLTKENAKTLLARTSIRFAAYESGLSGPGRLHDLLVNCEAVTPAEYRTKGAGLDIVYGFHTSPFGECLLALTLRGICFLAFTDGSPQSALAQLRRDWVNSSLREDREATRQVIEMIFPPLPFAPLSSSQPQPISLHLLGTNFQIKVWEALLRLPAGSVTSYGRLAEGIGSVNAAQAVGNAVARNPVAYLIPCHRVIQSTGGFGGYRYGAARKQAILGREWAQQER